MSSASEHNKLRLLAATGLDGAIVMRFDAALAATSAEDFVVEILAGELGIGGAAIGFDFHFGKNRMGSPAFLTEQGARLGFAVDVFPPLEDEGRPVSSGAVRAALAAGRVVEAAELLGAPWFVSGEVIHGDKRGRELGFPTANLKLKPVLRSQARHLRCARQRCGKAPWRRRELRPPSDVRRRSALARGVPVRL